MASRYPDAIHLEIGQPHFTTPSHIIEAAYRAAQEGFTGYTSNPGFPSLRKLIAEVKSRELGIPLTPDHIITTLGGTGAMIASLLLILERGDEILVPDPAWPNYSIMAQIAGAKVVYYPLRRPNFYPDLQKLRELISPRTKALILNSPSNPTGAVYPESIVRELLTITQEHDLYLISDEVYDRIIFEGKHISPLQLAPDERIISIFSFSKTYAMTGWRIGYIIVHPNLGSQYIKLQEMLIACPPSISQKAAEAALQGPQDCVEEMVQAYRRGRDAALEILEEHGIRSYRPQGAFYMLLDISSSGLKSMDFARELLEKYRVAVAPGITFGPSGEGYVRISFATTVETLREGLRRLLRFLRECSEA